jgi:hypothetical protein
LGMMSLMKVSLTMNYLGLILQISFHLTEGLGSEVG